MILEVDEDQHLDCPQACETSRLANIYTALALEGNTLPVTVIRFNPGKFHVDGIKKRVPTKARQDKLVEVIKSWEFGPSNCLEVQYMYYDMTNGCLDIWQDEGFAEILKSCCRQPISRGA